MGRVGQVMARNARGLNMEIHYHNQNRLPPEMEQGAIYHSTLESLPPVADFLSLHCPATGRTTGMMNAARLAMLADGQALAAVCTPPELSHIVRPDAELASTLQPAYRLSQSLYAHLSTV